LNSKPYYQLSEGTPMIGNNLARLTGSKRNLLALLASSALFTAGCANMATTAPDANPFSSAATLSGNIHGGSQPVVNAAVTLYYAGQKGSSGFPVTIAATTTTDANGNFTFVKDPTDGDSGSGNMYSCPLHSTVASPLVYVIAAGGNTAGNISGPSNSGAAFIGVFGSCTAPATASTQLFLNEVTTVATMAVMQQFFDPVSEGIVADGTGQQYNVLNNVTNTINLLVNSASGAVVPSTILKAPTSAGHFISRSVQVTATPESTKINLLANILSTCINQATVAGCSPLFTAAVPGNSSYTSNFQDGAFPAATDTLQAIYYLLTNPSNGSTANLATTFGLAPGAGAPYQPALATQPTDWTIAINYASTGGLCGTSSAGGGGFIDTPSDIAIDATNNVWIANSKTGTGNLSELSFAGVPTTCILLGSGGLQGVTIDSANATSTGGGNIWVGSGTNMYRFTPTTFATSTYPVAVAPLAVGADGLGNVYFTSAATTSLYQLPLAASTTGVVPLQISNSVGTAPIRLMPDFQGKTVQSNILVSSGSNFVSKVSPGAGGLNGFVTTPITTSGNSYGLSLGPDNSLYVSALDTGAITGLLAGTGSVYTTAVNGFPFTAATAGIAAPTSISVDGRANVWIPNNTNGTDASSNPAGSVSYIARDATALSPATGFQKNTTYLNSGRALAVDQAGNVWVAGDGNSYITEIVGAGVPLFQPYAAGLAVGRFQTIP
jgi:hypothetical protein